MGYETRSRVNKLENGLRVLGIIVGVSFLIFAVMVWKCCRGM
jgi:hypothetical protein